MLKMLYSDIEINNSEENRIYELEVEAYRNNPVKACSRTEALKILKRFYTKDFYAFWFESVEQYLPAVSSGIMKLPTARKSHSEALAYAKDGIMQLDVNELAKAYLYGLAHNKPEYCSALASYYYILNLPEHKLEKKYLGNNGKSDVYDDSQCEICEYFEKSNIENKSWFWSINMDMADFYLYARMPLYFRLDKAILYLEEYKKLEGFISNKEDYQFFLEIIDIIEKLPKTATASDLCDKLYKSRLLKATKEQIGDIIDMLGYLNILHTPDCFGVTKQHTNVRDMKEPLSPKSHNAYPVNRWQAEYGVDYEWIEKLFGSTK